MPNPIDTVPNAPFVITPTVNASAESFVGVLLQIFEHGTTGLANPADETDATCYPTDEEGHVGSLRLRTKEQQLFFRQLGVAISALMTGTVPGQDPELVPGVFSAVCPQTAVVGDLVRPVPGTETTVDLVDITDLTKMPAVGCITQKPTPTTAVVRTSGIVTGVFSNLQPGKRYFVGRNSRIALPLTIVPAVGEVLLHQPIGLAIDYTIMLMSPSMGLTRTRGS
jgi:hypothetical protein